MKQARPCVLSTLVIALSLSLLACTQATSPGSGQGTASPAKSTSPTTKAPTSAGAVSFAGKTVTIIVPFTPGGGTDLSARLFAKHLGRFLPGNPGVVVRNMPGGANTIGPNYVYESKPDGLTLLQSAAGVHLPGLLGAKAARYDLLKMPTLAAFSNSNIYVVRSKAVANTDDLAKPLPGGKMVTFGFTSAGGGPAIFMVAKELIGFPSVKVVTGYSGTADVFRALLAGETDGGNVSGPQYLETVSPLVKKGEFLPAFQSGIMDAKGALIKDPVFPADIPTGEELYQKIHGKSPAGLIAFEAYRGLVAATQAIGKALFLPPNSSDALVKVYWDAMDRMMKDKEYVQNAEVILGKDTGVVSGEAADKLFKAGFTIKPEVRVWVIETLSTKYQFVLE